MWREAESWPAGYSADKAPAILPYSGLSSPHLSARIRVPPFLPSAASPNPQEYTPFLLPQFLQVPTSHHFLLHALLAFAPAHTPCDVLRHSHGQVWLAGSCCSLEFCSSPAQVPVPGWGNLESPLGEKTFPGHSGHETGGSVLLQICAGSLGL